MAVPGNTEQIRLIERSPMYWRVTFNHPPLNVFGPESIPQLSEIAAALASDKSLDVVVSDNAVEGFFLPHYDFLAELEDSTSLPPGPTRLPVKRPAAQERISKLMQQGFHKPGGVESRLGYYVGQLGQYEKGTP
jgi:enoyl-CoA hydratase/carnithine racemase